MAKITKKRNDLKFCNDLPCNNLYVSTVYILLIMHSQNTPKFHTSAFSKIDFESLILEKYYQKFEF